MKRECKKAESEEEESRTMEMHSIACNQISAKRCARGQCLVDCGEELMIGNGNRKGSYGLAVKRRSNDHQANGVVAIRSGVRSQSKIRTRSRKRDGYFSHEAPLPLRPESVHAIRQMEQTCGVWVSLKMALARSDWFISTVLYVNDQKHCNLRPSSQHPMSRKVSSS